MSEADGRVPQIRLQARRTECLDQRSEQPYKWTRKLKGVPRSSNLYCSIEKTMDF